MSATTTTLVGVGGPDVAVVKTETFDVEFAKWIVDQKDIPKEDTLLVRRLYKERINANQHETQYKLGKDIKSQDLGRLFPVRSVGLASLPRDIRSALAQKYYFDVDIVNCQPTLLQQYAAEKGWVTTNLKLYLDNRDEYLEELKGLGMERWEAKERICRLMFGGSADGLTPFFVESLLPEVRSLMRNVFNANQKEYPSVAKRGERSLMALVLQTEERKCLLALDLSLAKQGRSLDVLIHDGGLVRKKDGETRLPDEVLRRCEADIKADTGYSVRLAIKELKTTLVREESDTVADYQERKTMWEQTGWKGAVWFKLRFPACFVALMKDGSLFQMSRSDVMQNEEDNLLPDGEPFIKQWLADPDKREYERLVFLPKQDPPQNCFNLFRGLACVPAAGDFSAFQISLRIVSGNDQAVFDYIENWLAHIIQKPSEKTRVCIVVQGDQGAGKDSFFDAVGGGLFGEYYFKTDTPENDVFARFNPASSRKLLIKFEEADFHTNKENASRLKSLITSSTGRLEKKGHDPIDLDDFSNIVMTTNQEVPVVVEDSDRRFLLVKASSERVGDTDFWWTLWRGPNGLASKEGASAYHHYLLHKDIRTFIPHDPKTIPKTQYYKDTKQSFIPYHARFFQKQVELNEEIEEREYQARSLFNQIKQDAPAGLQLSETRFGRDMRLYVDAGCLTKTKGKSHNNYVLRPQVTRQFLEQRGWWVTLA